MSSDYRPEMTEAGLSPTTAVIAIDEYQNRRQLHVAEERALTIYIDSYEIVTLMTLGTQPEMLALGYLKNQGLIKKLSEIKSIQVDWDVNTVAVTTFENRDDWKDKLGTRIVTTGCGQGTVFGNIMEKPLKEIWFDEKVVRDNTTLMFTIKRNEDNELLGCCGFVYINWVHRHADMSLYIGWEDAYIDNKGYAEESCRLLLDYGFNELCLNKVWTEIYEFDNKKKVLYDQFGFQQDGLLRQNYW